MKADTPLDTYIIGDIHGQHDKLVQLLKRTGLITDTNSPWFEARLFELGVKVERIQLEEAGDEGRELRLEVVLPASVSGREVVEHLSQLDEVLAVRWDE